MGPRGTFCINRIDIRGPRNLKNDQNSKNFLELERTKSKLSVDIFWVPQDHLVVLKSTLKINFCRLVANSCKPPPLVSQLRDIHYFPLRLMDPKGGFYGIMSGSQ